MPVRLFGSVAFDPPPQKGLIKKVALGKTKRPPIDPSRFPRKWGYAPDHALKEKRHYGAGNTDFFEKQRLCARDFSFQRHPWYPNLVDQKKDSLAYEGDRYERFRRDVAGMLKAERHNARRKQEAMDQEWRNIKLCREYDLRTGREESFVKQEKREAERRKNVGNISNKNSTAYNPITLQYHDGYEGDKLTYEDKATKWRQAMRSIYLQKKINGDRKFNWMGWTPRPTPVEPIKPIEPKAYCRTPKRIDIEVTDG